MTPDGWQALATWALAALYAVHWIDLRRLRILVSDLRVEVAYLKGVKDGSEK